MSPGKLEDFSNYDNPNNNSLLVPLEDTVDLPPTRAVCYGKLQVADDGRQAERFSLFYSGIAPLIESYCDTING